MTTPSPPLPVPDTSTSATIEKLIQRVTDLNERYDIIVASFYLDDQDVEAATTEGSSVARQLKELTPQLADALRAVLASRDALAAREARVRAVLGQCQVEAHNTYHANRECIQMTEDCQYERGLIDGLTRSVNGILSVLDAPVSSAPTSTEAGP